MRARLILAAAMLPAVMAVGCSPEPPPPPKPKITTDAYITAYTWFDNTPQGSPEISHQVVHKKAGGVGTYADPVTIAVGHSFATGQDVLDFPAGTRIYLPDVRRYFIVEDTCGDGPTPEKGPCHSGARENGASIWLDMWIGGEGEERSFVDRCMEEVTGVRTAVFDPPDNYVVAAGNGVIHDGKCDSGYGNELVTK